MPMTLLLSLDLILSSFFEADTILKVRIRTEFLRYKVLTILLCFLLSQNGASLSNHDYYGIPSYILREVTFLRERSHFCIATADSSQYCHNFCLASSSHHLESFTQQ